MEEYLVDKISIIKYSKNEYGEITLENIIDNIQTRIDFSSRIVTNLKGEEEVSSAKIYLDKKVQIDYSNKIKFDNKEWRIIKIEQKKDFDLIYQIVYVA